MYHIFYYYNKFLELILSNHSNYNGYYQSFYWATEFLTVAKEVTGLKNERRSLIAEVGIPLGDFKIHGHWPKVL